MPKFSAVFLHLQHGALQSEIPFCRAVGVVDQHEVRIVFQALGLPFHGAAVLLDEFAEDELQEIGAEGDPAKKVPGGYYVDAAPVTCDGRYGGEAREPVFPGANDLRTEVRQHKIDGRGDRVGIGVETQKLVGSAV